MSAADGSDDDIKYASRRYCANQIGVYQEFKRATLIILVFTRELPGRVHVDRRWCQYLHMVCIDTIIVNTLEWAGNLVQPITSWRAAIIMAAALDDVVQLAREPHLFGCRVARALASCGRRSPIGRPR